MMARFSSIAAFVQKLFMRKKTQKLFLRKKTHKMKLVGRKSPAEAKTLELGISLLHPHSSSSSAEVLSTLGRGAFGHVFKIRLIQPNEAAAAAEPKFPLLENNKSGSGGVVALKIFKNKGEKSIVKEISMSLRLSGMATGKTPIVRALNAHTTEVDGAHLKELGMASNIRQPRLHMYRRTNHLTKKEELPRALHCMSMELCQGGDLQGLLDRIGLMTETEALSFFYPLAKGIQFCHKNRVLHLDVKPQNVLFRKKGKLETACLTDFSLAMAIPMDKPTVAISNLSDALRSTPGTGTDHFMAPEVAVSGYYSPLADVFSLGCILLVAVTGISFSWNQYVQWPHHDRRHVADVLFNADGNRKAWESLSDNMKRLITGMLCPDPLRRLNLHQVLYDPWIVEKVWGNLLGRYITYVYEAWAGIKQAMAHFLGLDGLMMDASPAGDVDRSFLARRHFV